MHTDYTGQGVDQLTECIEKIKNNPEDRRIIMSAWNPADLNVMALPPCHMFCQFYVNTEKNELSCQIYVGSSIVTAAINAGSSITIAAAITIAMVV